MKRNFLLLAVPFTFSCGAHAQSSVTLYGALDTGLLYQSGSTDNRGKGFAAIDGGSGPSLWGLAGTEDIGGGYKTHFKLEGGYSTVSGSFGDSNGNFFGRQAYVGIEAPFGTLNAGLQFSPFYLSTYTADPRGQSFFASGLAQYINSFGLAGSFDSNALVYSSPSFAGLSGSAEYAFGNVAGSFPAGRHISGALNYDNGLVSATVAYFEAKDVTSGVTTYRGDNIGVGYKLGPVEVKLEFTKYRNSMSNAALTNINIYAAGLDWFVTDVWKLDAGVYATRDQNVTANKSMLYGTGAEYFLSRRTMLYAQLGVVDNKAAMNTELEVNAPSTFNVRQGTTVGIDVGIRHTF